MKFVFEQPGTTFATLAVRNIPSYLVPNMADSISSIIAVPKLPPYGHGLHERLLKMIVS